MQFWAAGNSNPRELLGISVGNVRNLDLLSRLTSLRSLSLHDIKLRHMAQFHMALTALKGLEALELSSSIFYQFQFPVMPKLQSLSCEHCHLEEVGGLEKQPSLTEISLFPCRIMCWSAADMMMPRSLAKAVIGLTEGNNEMAVRLLHLPSLTELEVRKHGKEFIEDASQVIKDTAIPVATHEQLTTLRLRCISECQLSSIAKFSGLRELLYNGGTSAAGLQALSGSLRSLTTLQFSHNSSLCDSDVRCIASLSALEIINFDYIGEGFTHNSLPILASLPHLSSIIIYQCNGFASLAGVSACKNLRRLEVASSAYQRIPDADADAISRLSQLETLVLHWCQATESGMRMMCSRLSKLRKLQNTPYSDESCPSSVFASLPLLSHSLEELTLPPIAEFSELVPVIAQLTRLRVLCYSCTKLPASGARAIRACLPKLEYAGRRDTPMEDRLASLEDEYEDDEDDFIPEVDESDSEEEETDGEDGTYEDGEPGSQWHPFPSDLTAEEEEEEEDEEDEEEEEDED